MSSINKVGIHRDPYSTLQPPGMTAAGVHLSSSVPKLWGLLRPFAFVLYVNRRYFSATTPVHLYICFSAGPFSVLRCVCGGVTPLDLSTVWCVLYVTTQAMRVLWSSFLINLHRTNQVFLLASFTTTWNGRWYTIGRWEQDLRWAWPTRWFLLSATTSCIWQNESGMMIESAHVWSCNPSLAYVGQWYSSAMLRGSMHVFMVRYSRVYCLVIELQCCLSLAALVDWLLACLHGFSYNCDFMM